MRRRPLLRHLDKALFLAPLAIFLIGLVSLYSASLRIRASVEEGLVIRQCLWMGIGTLLVFLMARINYFKLQDFALPVYLLSIFLLVAVLFAPARLGAHRWISIAGFNFQPSELAKIACILALARYFSGRRYEHCGWPEKLAPFAILAVPCLLIFKEPDLGTALLLVPVFFAMMYLWGFPGRRLALLALLGAAAAPVLFHLLKDYQKARLLVFINPNADPLGAGYTIIQSKIAIGSGGLWGKGFLSGTQNRLNFLPERHTDFIFGVIGEEGGFVAGAAVLALFWVIVSKGFSITAQTPDRFGSQLACGVTTLLAVHVVVNLGMTMGLLPVVGVPLPLVSYGGSSLIATMTCIGLLLNIKLYKPLF